LKYLILIFLIPLSFATTLEDTFEQEKDPQIIGGAYNSKGRFFSPGIRCVEVDEQNNVKQVFNNQGNVDFSTETTQDSLTREFGFGFAFDGKTPNGDGYGFSMDHFNSTFDTNYSFLNVYKTTVYLGSELLEGPYKLTEEAVKLAEEDPSRFEEVCGDEFVSRINKGGVGVVTAKLDIQSHEDKQTFDSELSLSFVNLLDFSAYLKKLRERTNVEAKLTISGQQEGGFSARINGIFGTGGGVSSCHLAALSDCAKILGDVVTYFSKDFGTQFDPYFRDSSGSGVIILPNTATPLSYVTTSYCKLTPPNRPPNLKCDDQLNNQNQVNEMEEKRKIYMEELNRLENFARTRGSNLAQDYSKLVSIYASKINSNLKKIKLANLNCSRDKWTCKSEVEQLNRHLYPILPNFLEKIGADERVEICYKSGKKVDISGLELRVLKGSAVKKAFPLYSSPSADGWDCFYYSALELNGESFDSTEIRVRPKSENKNECRIHSKRLFSSWTDWELDKVTIRHFKTGAKKTFEGKYFSKKMKCASFEDSREFLDWQKMMESR
jgi:hypothetical protein